MDKYYSFRGKPIQGKEAAEGYISKRFSSPRMRRLDKMEQRFARDLAALVGPDKAILDIPCGSGRFFEIFSSAKELFMFDYSPGMVETLLENFPEARNKTVGTGDIMNIPLEDNRVDLAFCMRLFHHFPDGETRKKALRELARVSRKYVAFSFYCSDCWRYFRKRLLGKKPHGFGIPMKQMLQEAEECGLKFLQMRPAFPYFQQQRCLLFEKR